MHDRRCEYHTIWTAPREYARVLRGDQVWTGALVNEDRVEHVGADPHRGSSAVRELLDLNRVPQPAGVDASTPRSEEHTSELQSRENLVCRLLLEKENVQTND